MTLTTSMRLLTNFKTEVNIQHNILSTAAVVTDQPQRLCSTCQLSRKIRRISYIHVKESASPAVCLTPITSKVVLLQCVFCNRRGPRPCKSPSSPPETHIAEWPKTVYPVTNRWTGNKSVFADLKWSKVRRSVGIICKKNNFSKQHFFLMNSSAVVFTSCHGIVVCYFIKENVLKFWNLCVLLLFSTDNKVLNNTDLKLCQCCYSA